MILCLATQAVDNVVSEIFEVMEWVESEIALMMMPSRAEAIGFLPAGSILERNSRTFLPDFIDFDNNVRR